jgi:ribose transport system permease protein
LVSDAAGKPRDTEPRSAPLREMGRRALEVESNSVLVATVALIVFIGIVHPDFLEWGQLKEVVQNATYVGIIAAGMAFLLSMREIDLSVGSMFGLTLVSAALFMQHGMNPWLAALLGILLGCAMGLLNAILVQFIAIPAIVATLATLSMCAASRRRSARASRSPGCRPRTSSSRSSAATRSSACRSASG